MSGKSSKEQLSLNNSANSTLLRKGVEALFPSTPPNTNKAHRESVIASDYSIAPWEKSDAKPDVNILEQEILATAANRVTPYGSSSRKKKANASDDSIVLPTEKNISKKSLNMETPIESSVAPPGFNISRRKSADIFVMKRMALGKAPAPMAAVEEKISNSSGSRAITAEQLLSNIKTYSFSLKHDIIYNPNTSYPEEGGPTAVLFKPTKEATTINICVYHPSGSYHVLDVMTNTTANEILMEVLCRYGEVVPDQYQLRLHGQAKKPNLNYPIQYFRQYFPATMEFLSTLNSQAPISEVYFYITKKPLHQFTAVIEVAGLHDGISTKRIIAVNTETTVKEALELILNLEFIAEEDRNKYRFYGATTMLNNSRSAKKLKPAVLDSNDKPFKMEGSMDFFVDFLGSESVGQIQEYSNGEDVKRKADAMKSFKLSNLLGIHEGDKYDPAKKNNFRKSMQPMLVSESKNLENSSGGFSSFIPGWLKNDQLSPLPPQIFSGTIFDEAEIHKNKNINARTVDSDPTSSGGLNVAVSNDSLTSQLTRRLSLGGDHATDPNKGRKHNKLIDFFGVKAGEKEISVINNLSRDKDAKNRLKKTEGAGGEQAVLIRIYFANLTYTNLSLPISGTAENAVSEMLTKFRIKESSSLYGIFVYHQSNGVETPLHPTDKLFETMITWTENEIFLFKRKTMMKRLRAQEMKSMDLMSQESILSKAPETECTDDADNLIDDEDPIEKSGGARVAKLTNFFGVGDEKKGHTKGKHNDSRIKKKKKEMAELHNIFKELSKHIVDKATNVEPVTPKDHANANSLSKLHKEGWLELYDEKKTWRTCWCAMNQSEMAVKYANSKEEAVPAVGGAQQGILNIKNYDLITNQAGSSKMKEKGAIFSFRLTNKKTGDSFKFGSASQLECAEWIQHIQKVFVALIREKAARKESLIDTLLGKHTQADKQQESDKTSKTSSIEESSSGNISPQKSPLPALPSDDLLKLNAVKEQIEDKMSLSDFKMHKVLGRGKYAKVLLCSQKSTGMVFAMKVVNKQSDGIEPPPKNESLILQTVKHPFIVGLHFAFESASRLYMVMEYVNGGELFFHISNFGRFSNDRVQFYAAEILLALECLHGNGFIYRDLKLENILLDKDGHVKIADFGLSKREAEEEEVSNHVVGTLEYLAPEVLLGKKAAYVADWWAYGVVCFEMFCGYHPFYSEDREEIRKNILGSPIEYPEHLSMEAMNFLSKLMNRKPEKRLGNGGDKEIRNHKFFETIDFEALYKKELEAPFVPELVNDFDVRFFDEEFTAEPVSTPLGSDDEITKEIKE